MSFVNQALYDGAAWFCNTLQSKRLVRKPLTSTRFPGYEEYRYFAPTLTTKRTGNLTTVTATTHLVGTVYYYWFLEGEFVARTTDNKYHFWNAQGEQGRVDVFASNSLDWDYVKGAPAGYPPRVKLWWIRSVDGEAKYYRVDQKLGAGSWTTQGKVWHDNSKWNYEFGTVRLTDLGSYTWRIVPVDSSGNDGSVLTIGPETIVRTPDAPDYTISFDDGTTRVTFTAA